MGISRGTTGTSKIYRGATDITKVFRGTAQVWPNATGTTYNPKTTAYKNRVETAGGFVYDLNYVDSVYNKLDELGLYNSLRHWHSASAGVHKFQNGENRAAQYVNTMYSMDAGNFDAVGLESQYPRPWWHPDEPGVPRHVYYTKADKDYLHLAHNNAFNFTNTLSFEAWASTINNEYPNFFGKWATTNQDDSFIFRLNEGKLALFLHIGGSFKALIAPTVTGDTMNHYVGTYDGTTMRLYVNKVEVASMAQTGNVRVSASAVTFGRLGAYGASLGTGNMLEGQMPTARIWAKTLTQTEINELYNFR